MAGSGSGRRCSSSRRRPFALRVAVVGNARSRLRLRATWVLERGMPRCSLWTRHAVRITVVAYLYYGCHGVLLLLLLLSQVVCGCWHRDDVVLDGEHVFRLGSGWMCLC